MHALHVVEASLTILQATTKGKVSIALLRGPSDLAEEFQCLANSIDNTGTFQWKLDPNLEDDTLRYGLKIIVDDTGEYQYSPQFGVKVPEKCKKPKEDGKDKDHKSEKPKEHKSETPKEHKSEESKEPKPTHLKHHNGGNGGKHHNKGSTPPPEQPGHGKDTKPGYPSGKPSIYSNSTVPYPTSTSHKSSTTKSASKSSKATKPKDSTSTDIVTSTPSSPEQGQVTSNVVVTNTPGAEGPGTVTTSAPGTEPSVESSNSAANLEVCGALLAGVAGISLLLL